MLEVKTGYRAPTLPIYLIGLGHGATHWIIAAVYVALPLLRTDLGFDYAATGAFVTLFWASSFLANPVSGPVVDLTGHRLLWQSAALILGTLALMLLAASSQYWVMCAAMVAIGATNNLWHPAAISYLSARFPGRKGYALSIHALGANAGDALAPLAMAGLLGFLAWRDSLSAMGLVPVAVAIALLFLRRSQSGAADSKKDGGLEEYRRSLVLLARDRRILGLCLMSGFRNMAQAGLLIFLPLYLADIVGLDAPGVGVALFLFQGAGIVAAPIAGILSDRIGRAPIVLGGLGATTVLLLLLPLLTDGLLFVAGMALMGFTLFALRPVVHSWVMDLTPEGMGASATAMLFGIQAVMSLSTPVIGGILSDAYGLEAAFWFLGACMAIANGVGFRLAAITRGAGG